MGKIGGQNRGNPPKQQGQDWIQARFPTFGLGQAVAPVLAGAAGVGFLGGVLLSLGLTLRPTGPVLSGPSLGEAIIGGELNQALIPIQAANGRPLVSPLPRAQEVWQCQVVVVGGSLGGVSAAAHAMAGGARTCLIEAAPWLGGQISSQGVSALDESRAMRRQGNFPPSWAAFRQQVRNQVVTLPPWTGLPSPSTIGALNSCWVGELCFLPEAGAIAAQRWLEQQAVAAPGSRWSAATAFKGAAFDPSGRTITAIYGVRRTPRQADYAPQGRLSRELVQWYSWSSDDTYAKTVLRLEAPPGERMIVIDATDTGELVGWAQIPHRLGSDAQSLLGEANAPRYSNPACTQAFTYPFALAIANDQGASYRALQQIETGISREEHRRAFDMEGAAMFHNQGLFNYRRIVSRGIRPAYFSPSEPGDISLINWNRGNDWTIIDDPLIMEEGEIAAAGQYANWMGGLSLDALRNGENHALRFAEWLLENFSSPDLPMMYLRGPSAPLGTHSGLSQWPYIREGRRILGRPAYGQEAFMIREADLRLDLPGGRDFSATSVAIAHYDIDIHGCRYRNWLPSHEANQAGTLEAQVRPLLVPLESLIPIGVDNLLIGGKALAVSHIANGMTRVHQPEWSIGGAAGGTAAWLVRGDAQGRVGQNPLGQNLNQPPPRLTPADLLSPDQMPQLQTYLGQLGLRYRW